MMDGASYAMLAVIVLLICYVIAFRNGARISAWWNRYPRTDLPCHWCKEVKPTRMTTYYVIVSMHAIDMGYRMCMDCESRSFPNGTATTLAEILMAAEERKKKA